MARPRRTVGRRFPPGRLDQVEFGATYPCIRGWQDAVQTTIGNGGDPDRVSFDVWENCSPDYFDVQPSGSPLQIDNVNCLVSGLYAVHFSTDFDGTLPVGTNVGLSVDQAGSSFTSPSVAIMPAHPRAGDLSTARYAMADVRAYPPIWVHYGATSAALGPSLPNFSFNVAQDSASDFDTQGAMFEIYLLGAIPCDITELGV